MKIRNEGERNIVNLERVLRDRDNEIKRYLEEIGNCKGNIDNLEEDNTKLFTELEKMKNHILVLTEQNQKYCEELDNFVDQDEKLRAQLNKRERVNLIKSSNQFYLEKSLSNLDNNNNNNSAVAGDSRGFSQGNNSRAFSISKGLSPRSKI